MKVFICPSFPERNKLDLLSALTMITFADSRLTQVVAVDEVYETLCNKLAEAPKCNLFGLSDLINRNASNTSDETSIDHEKLAKIITAAQSNWLCIDLGYHGTSLSEKMIEDVARIGVVSSSLAQKNIVFLVDPAFLAHYARKANEAFNILCTNPKNDFGILNMFIIARMSSLYVSFVQSNQVIFIFGMLFRSIYRSLSRSRKVVQGE